MFHFDDEWPISANRAEYLCFYWKTRTTAKLVGAKIEKLIWIGGDSNAFRGTSFENVETSWIS